MKHWIACVSFGIFGLSAPLHARADWHCQAYCVVANLQLRAAYGLGLIEAESRIGKGEAWRKLAAKCLEFRKNMEISSHYTPYLARDYFGDFRDIRIRSATPKDSCVQVKTSLDPNEQYHGPENPLG